MSTGTSESRLRRWFRATKQAIAVLVFILLIIFIAENLGVVKVRLIVWHTEIRLAWALLLSAALGFIAGWLLPHLRR